MGEIRKYLATLAETGEREDPLVFVGREQIIERILRASQSMPSAGGGAGRTFLIEGAPGTGKTALVSELAKRLNGEGVATIVCDGAPGTPSGIDRVYRKLAVALGAALPGEERTTTTSGRESSGGIGSIFRGRLSRSKSVAPPSIGDVGDIVERLDESKRQPDKHAVVFIDEIQNLEPKGPAANLVCDLHTQHSAPILLVCAGLSNSKRVLARAGLSRINARNVVRLGRFSPEETLDCARKTLETVREAGLPSTDAATERWAGRIAQAVDDWPRHLQCYLTACWETLTTQDIPDLDTADLNTAMALGDSLRNTYYLDRIDASESDIRVLGELHRHLGAGERISPADAHRIIGEAAARLDPENRKAHEDRFPHGEACFERMLQSGVVSLNDEGDCTSPLPSLSDHILAKYDREAGSSSGQTERPMPTAPSTPIASREPDNFSAP